MSKPPQITDRRRFIQIGSAALGASVVPPWAAAQAAPAIVPLDASRPNALQGVQFGDPSRGSVLAWSRSDRPSRMVVEWSLDAQFTQATRIVGPYALEDSDYTAKQDISGLPSNREVFVRVSFQSLANSRALSEPVHGRFVAPTPASVQAAAAVGPWDAAAGFDTLLVNRRGEHSYPIVAAVFGLMNERSTGFRRSLTRTFFEWSLTNGREAAQRLGYTPLPAGVVQEVLTTMR